MTVEIDIYHRIGQGLFYKEWFLKSIEAIQLLQMNVGPISSIIKNTYISNEHYAYLLSLYEDNYGVTIIREDKVAKRVVFSTQEEAVSFILRWS